MEIKKSRTDEIVRLHSEIIGHLKTSLEKAIRIGELLAEQKATLRHGQFTLWIKKNLPFTDRTARNYMRLWRERDRLKAETVSDLKAAYKLLAPSNIKKLEQKIEHSSEVAEIQKLKLEAEALSREADKKLSEILPSVDDILGLMTTDYFEATPIGLVQKRQPTEQECVEYLHILKMVGDSVKVWRAACIY